MRAQASPISVPEACALGRKSASAKNICICTHQHHGRASIGEQNKGMAGQNEGFQLVGRLAFECQSEAESEVGSVSQHEIIVHCHNMVALLEDAHV